MSQIRFKTKILWAKQIQWQFSKYQKAYSSLNRRDYPFQTAKRAFQRVPRDGGLIPGKSKGSLTKIPPERVSASVSRWIIEGRLRLDAREREKKNQLPAVTPHGGTIGGSPEFLVWAIPASKLRKKTTNMQRSLPRTRLGTLFEPIRLREGLRCGLADATPCTRSAALRTTQKTRRKGKRAPTESGALCGARGAIVDGSRAEETKDHGGGRLSSRRDPNWPPR